MKKKKKIKKSWVYEIKVLRFKIESMIRETTVRPPWCQAEGEEQGDNIILRGGSLDQLNRENIGNA